MIGSDIHEVINTYLSAAFFMENCSRCRCGFPFLFEVFEVNSSSLRSGKQLLSQLEEATQSHKVAQKKTSDFGVDEVIVVENLEQKKFKKDNLKQKAKSDVMPLASSLTSFFKAMFQLKKGKKSTNLLEETNEQNASSGHVNLSTVSLILFDEVDVVFEDDKGFLATVQHFMTSTKIPIILTCADRHFYHQLSARHDHIIFKKPSKGSVAKYLSTVCLSNGVYVDPTTMSSLVNHLNGDIRSCLLSLQYWCESGGGRVQKYSHSSHNATATKPDCDDKTSLFKVKCKKMMVIDDEESTSSVSSINMKPKQKFAAIVHRDIVETLLGLPTGDRFSLQTVLKLLNVPVSDGQKFSEVLDQLPVMNEVFQRNCIYQVALVCLSLPKIEPSIVDMTALAKKVSIHKDTRKRILHSWCDSDSSDDSPDQNNESEMRDSGLSTDNQCNKLNLACDAAKDNNTKLNISVLSEMARFYDSMSYIDCLQSTCNRTVEKCGTSPGINDMEPLYHQNYHIDHDFVNPTVCAVSLLASRKMSQNVDASINVWLEREGFLKNSTDDNSGPINIWPEEFQLPIGQSGTHDFFNDNHLLYR
ncbi:ATPase AAA domain-containing protein 5 [Bulinus truncatus]|nr:ATPase AAA domain-containing protein 5 [Bulinus truncatus]